jgi:hypothetical protein
MHFIGIFTIQLKPQPVESISYERKTVHPLTTAVYSVQLSGVVFTLSIKVSTSKLLAQRTFSEGVSEGVNLRGRM